LKPREKEQQNEVRGVGYGSENGFMIGPSTSCRVFVT
jgi:hypothetical protein